MHSVRGPPAAPCLLPFARWLPTQLLWMADQLSIRSAIRVYIPYAGHGPLSEIAIRAAASTLSYLCTDVYHYENWRPAAGPWAYVRDRWATLLVRRSTLRGTVWFWLGQVEWCGSRWWSSGCDSVCVARSISPIAHGRRRPSPSSYNVFFQRQKYSRSSVYKIWSKRCFQKIFS